MKLPLALILAAAFVAPSAQAATYTLDPRNTEGVFRWEHLGFSHPSAEFSGVEGSLEFDPADPAAASVQATIPIAQIHTGVPDLDEHFQTSDFFDLKRFTTATFKSTAVRPGAQADHFTVLGDLNLHGVTKPVTLDVTLNKIGPNARTQLPSIGFDGTARIKRSDFGLGRFVPQVGDEIAITLTLEAVEAKAYAAYLEAEAKKESK